MKSQRMALLATLVASLGISSSALAQKAEVIHWWTSGGESAALKQLAEAYNKAGGQWVDNAIAGGDNARAAALNRIAGGNPPVASQFNTSKQYHELIDAGLLADVDAVASKEGWDTWLPVPIKDVIKVKGKYYAVPVNIHSSTWFFYSKAVLAKAGVAEPKNEAEFWTALDKIKASGQIPFAQSGTLSYEVGTFNAVLLHMGGRDLYMKVYGEQDPNAIRSPAFKTVIEKYKRLRTYSDPGFAGRSWNDTTALLVTDKAAFQTVGDWAKGEFLAAGKTAGKEFGCFSGWGPKAAYSVSGDVFVLPKNSNKDAIAAQQLLARVITAPATQVAFNNKKGSIPIRPDVDTSGLDICAQAGVQALKDTARQTPDARMLIAPDMHGKLSDVVTKLWNTDLKPEDAQTQFVAALKK